MSRPCSIESQINLAVRLRVSLGNSPLSTVFWIEIYKGIDAERSVRDRAVTSFWTPQAGIISIPAQDSGRTGKEERREGDEGEKNKRGIPVEYLIGPIWAR